MIDGRVMKGEERRANGVEGKTDEVVNGVGVCVGVGGWIGGLEGYGGSTGTRR